MTVQKVQASIALSEWVTPQNANAMELGTPAHWTFFPATTIPDCNMPPFPDPSHSSGCWLKAGHGGTTTNRVMTEPATPIHEVR
jgi:hypothetical protein